MTRPLLALSADWHERDGAWRNKGVLGDAYHSLEQLVDYCCAHGADLIGAGDLYDVDDPDPKSVTFVHRMCDRLEAAGRRLYYIDGQHERHRSGGHWIGSHSMPIHLTPDAAHELAGVRFSGFDWTPPSGLPGVYERLAALGALDLVVCHQVWVEFMGLHGEATLAELPGDGLVLTGDYHVTKLVDLGGRLILSPGSLCMQSINEDAEKFFFVLDSDMGLHRIPLKTRRVGRYAVSTGDQLDRLLSERPWESLLDDSDLPPSLRKPIVAVSFPDSLAFAAKRLAAALEEEVHYFPRLIAARRAASSSASDAAAPRLRTLVEALGAELAADDPSYASVRRLLECRPADLPAELARLREEFMASYPRNISASP